VHHVRVALAIVAVILAVPLASVLAQDDSTAWCTSHDGKVVERYPASMATSDKPVALGESVQFCEFTGGEGADPADSRISVSLVTLASEDPSMAATAYLTRPAMSESGGSANPASVYCADLGGSELSGVLAPDGGWVNSDDTNDVAELCVFPDLSIIDSWGLAYHTIGTIRGANLESAFRWHPSA
jgi:putative hemolysin